MTWTVIGAPLNSAGTPDGETRMPAALRAAGIGAGDRDPPGGRLERDVDGALTGVLRERAMLPLLHAAQRLEGPGLVDAIGESVDELLGWGSTGATDAGDYDADGICATALALLGIEQPAESGLENETLDD